MSAQTPEHLFLTFRMQEVAQCVVKQLQPCQTQELADAQDRIRDLERQLAQEKMSDEAS